MVNVKKYILQLLTKSTCPLCHNHILWLRPEDESGISDEDDATFFVCSECEFIGQVSVGQVERI